MDYQTNYEANLGYKFTGKSYPLFIFDTYIKGDVGTRNWHSYIELYFALSGSGEILYDSEYIPIKENEFCIINSNVLHSLKSDDGVAILNIGISSEFCKACCLDIEQYTFERIFADNSLRYRLSNLANTYFQKADDKLYDAKLSMQLLDFCIHLISNHTRKKTKIIYDDPIQLAIGYIKANSDKKITLDDIAMQAGLSKYYLAHRFKDVTGYTTTEYINRIKCDRACIYFKTTNLSIKDVSNKLYFCSYDYFLRVFKKTVGCTVSQYISQNCENRA